MEDIENAEVFNNEKNHRFEIKINDDYGFVPYKIQDEQIALFHTEVPQELQGKGLGKNLPFLHSILPKIISLK